MINFVQSTTLNYIKEVTKEKRKSIGQFFTAPEVARFMGSLMECNKEHIRLLDVGAGLGILAAAICEHVLTNRNIKSIEVDLYENNNDILTLLNDNLQHIGSEFQRHKKIFKYNIKPVNFIVDNKDYWTGIESRPDSELYDVVISNPPYKKIGKEDEEAIIMSNIVYGQPNIYFLFMAMSAKLLKKDGEMIFITPRSFGSGAYFKSFRNYFFNNMKLTNLHLFVSREDVFQDNVLQETIITRAVRSDKNIEEVFVTQSRDMVMSSLTEYHFNYKTIIDMDSDNYFMFMPTGQEDYEIINLFHKFSDNLISLGFRLKTGPVVDFRTKENLLDAVEFDGVNSFPIFWVSNIDNNRIIWPGRKKEGEPQVVVKSEKQLLLPNKDYLVLKRFTSKEEKRRIQCAIYRKNSLKTDYISIENHLNYITCEKGCMAEEELFGLFVILNTTYFDKYYRILNGSTQVNATEVNAIPLPCKENIIALGKLALRNSNSLDEKFCDHLFESLFI